MGVLGMVDQQLGSTLLQSAQKVNIPMSTLRAIEKILLVQMSFTAPVLNFVKVNFITIALLPDIARNPAYKPNNEVR